MRKNPLGDFVLGTTGGALSAYLLCGAALVLFIGHALGLGPALPIVPAPDASAFLLVAVRLVQVFYYVGLACLVFLSFRFMQEVLRGHTVADAAREAIELPRLMY